MLTSKCYQDTIILKVYIPNSSTLKDAAKKKELKREISISTIMLMTSTPVSVIDKANKNASRTWNT